MCFDLSICTLIGTINYRNKIMKDRQYMDLDYDKKGFCNVFSKYIENNEYCALTYLISAC